jgi:hypothetical protein
MKPKHFIFLVIVAFVTLLYAPIVSAAPILGDALATFAVLGASGVTTDPQSTIGGNLGSYPTDGITGTYNFTSGSNQSNGGLSPLAQTQLDAAILAVNAFGPGTNIGSSLDTWQSSHGNVITPGTYTVTHDTTANLTGDLILDGLGSNTAVWNFLFTSDLKTANGSNVSVQGVGSGAGVGIYWSVASDATINGDTFLGNVLASGFIHSDGDLTVGCGRLLSANANVTLVGDSIFIGDCPSVGFDQRGDIGGNGGNGGVPVPEPATMLLLVCGLASVAGLRRKFK